MASTRRPRRSRSPRRTISEIVAAHGHAVQYVGPGDCSTPGCCGSSEGQSFGYTVGLHGWDPSHPELLVFGLDPDMTRRVLNVVAAHVRTVHPLHDGTVLESPDWGFRLAVERVPNPAEILFSANDHFTMPYGRSVEAMQLSYDDMLGRFPWQPGSRVADRQPRPGTFRA